MRYVSGDGACGDGSIDVKGKIREGKRLKTRASGESDLNQAAPPEPFLRAVTIVLTTGGYGCGYRNAFWGWRRLQDYCFGGARRGTVVVSRSPSSRGEDSKK